MIIPRNTSWVSIAIGVIAFFGIVNFSYASTAVYTLTSVGWLEFVSVPTGVTKAIGSKIIETSWSSPTQSCFGSNAYAGYGFDLESVMGAPNCAGTEFDVYINLFKADDSYVESFMIHRNNYQNWVPVSLDTTTHIISLFPENSTTTQNVLPSGVPVDFSLEAYISDDDVGFLESVYIYVRNIDQNVVLGQLTSPSDIVLFNESTTTAGRFSVATSTLLGDGCYRLHAQLRREVLGIHFLSPIYDEQSNQFTVGECGFLGTVRQRAFNEWSGFLASTSATSSQAMANSCNPFSAFDIRLCATYLIVPDTQKLLDALNYAKEDIVTKFPIGYITRFISIIVNSPTTTLPAFTVHVLTSSTTSETLTFDPGDMIAGGATLIESIHDPIYGKSARDIFEPLIKLSISLLVLLTIFSDITGSHRHETRHQQTQTT